MNIDKAKNQHNVREEDIAKGLIYACATIMIADGRVEKEEVEAFMRIFRFIGVSDKYGEEWVTTTLTEASDTCIKKGTDALLEEIANLLSSAKIEEKRSLFLAMLHLAISDNTFDKNELYYLDKIAESLQLSRLDVLTAALEFATDTQ